MSELSEASCEVLEELRNEVQKRFDSEAVQEIEDAISYAGNYYVSSERKSGQPYMYHPLVVALIAVKELGLARVAVISAILHDLYDFKDFDEKDVESRFGAKVLEIIRGLHKISGLYTHNITLQNQNYINLILNIVTDVRIILLKLADRLQNMRNINDFEDDKRISLAEEIGSLYAPIAHRLGLYNIKTEMENFWLEITRPGVYKNIVRQIEATSAERDIYIQKFVAPIKNELEKLKYNFEIKSRVKSVYSIWKKMEKQQVPFDEVYDLFATRIILDGIASENEKAECWNVYSVVSNLYKPNPSRLRDWVSTPKSSGYESLHTTVEGSDQKWAEIQIRTRRMDDVAEKGQAAHWRYKETNAKSQHDKWLAKVREVLESPDRTEEDISIESPSVDYSSNVFVFTPGGDIKKLSRGATIIDFAYSIHSKVGSQCTGARINGKIVPLKYKLKNGETVEVITSKKQQPNESWLNIAASSRVKNRIKRELKEIKYKHAEAGKEELKRKMNQLELVDQEDYIVRLLRHFKMNSAIDLYAAIAEDRIQFNEIKSLFLDQLEKDEETNEHEIVKVQGKVETKEEDYLIIGDDIGQVNYKLANCCSPVFGDKVFGFVSVDRGIVIHRNSCPNAKELKTKFPYRIIPVKWNTSVSEKNFLTDIRILGPDKTGVLNQISFVLTEEMHLNIQSLRIEAFEGIYEAVVSVMVRDNDHINFILQLLQKQKSILKAERLDY